MRITKENLINYLVDVKGLSEEEARKVVFIYGTSYLTKEGIEDCINFIK